MASKSRTVLVFLTIAALLLAACGGGATPQGGATRQPVGTASDGGVGGADPLSTPAAGDLTGTPIPGGTSAMTPTAGSDSGGATSGTPGGGTPGTGSGTGGTGATGAACVVGTWELTDFQGYFDSLKTELEAQEGTATATPEASATVTPTETPTEAVTGTVETLADLDFQSSAGSYLLTLNEDGSYSTEATDLELVFATTDGLTVTVRVNGTVSGTYELSESAGAGGDTTGDASGGTTGGAGATGTGTPSGSTGGTTGGTPAGGTPSDTGATGDTASDEMAGEMLHGTATVKKLNQRADIDAPEALNDFLLMPRDLGILQGLARHFLMSCSGDTLEYTPLAEEDSTTGADTTGDAAGDTSGDTTGGATATGTPTTPGATGTPAAPGDSTGDTTGDDVMWETDREPIIFTRAQSQ